ncbi:MAG: tRNA lysidine(34) synthetase TilS [bacterium]|jgi:tRNA(Ile)-lysidine synthase
MLEKVRKTLDRFQMLAPGDRVLVAVSGGPDSSALLHILWRLRDELGLVLMVAHLDHMLRGEESYQDARHVEEMAFSLGIPAVIKRVDVSAYRADHGGSLEAAAREVRYDFFINTARESGCRKIALGHNLDDQVETVLMRFLRGSGLAGLGGIPPVRRTGEVDIIRPLLEVDRAQILAYCREEGLKPRWDRTNEEPIYLRNKIRLKLLPWLEAEFNPNLRQLLAGNAHLWREENEYLDQEARKWYDRVATGTKDNMVSLNLDMLQELSPVLLRRILRRAIIAVKGDGVDLLQVHLQSAEMLVQRGRVGARLSLPGGIEIKRNYREVIVREEGQEEGTLPFCYPLPVPGEIIVPAAGLKLKARVVDRRDLGPHLRPGRKRGLFARESISEPLFVRNRRPGDRFYPRGLGGAKKVKDFFIDAKIPRDRRDSIPLLTTGNEIMWVVGRRRDQRFVVKPETKQVLVVETDTVKGETIDVNVSRD